MKLAAAFAACLLLSGPALSAGEEELATRLFDVSALLEARVDPPIGRVGLGDRAYDQYDEEWIEPAGFLDADALDELVTTLVSPRIWSMDGVEIAFEGNDARMRVTAPPEVLERVSALLSDLFAIAGQRISVRADLLTFDAAGAERLAACGALSALSRGRLDPAARAAVLAEAEKPGAGRSEGTIVVVPGRLGRFADLHAFSYVADMDVEIAQGSVVGDPVVAVATEGWLLNVRPFLLTDGTVWLEAVQQRAELAEPMRSVNPEAAPLGTIDLPAMAVERCLLAGRIRPGESLAAMRRTSGGPRALVALLLTPERTGTAPRDGGIGWVPAAALTSPGLSASGGWCGEDGGEWSSIPSPNRAGFLASPALVTEHLAPAVEDVGEATDGAGGAVATPTGVFAAEPETLARVRAGLAVREAAAFRTYRVHLEAREGDRVRSSLDLEVPAGRNAVWEDGVERTFLADWEVEVAQEARVGDPIVGRAFGGLLANLRLAPSPAGDRIAGRIVLAVVDLEPRFETRRTGNELTGIIEIPRSRQVVIEREVILEPGKPLAIEGSSDLGFVLTVEER